jgi:hypothetical protein
MADVQNERAHAQKQPHHESNPGQHLSALFPERPVKSYFVV